MKFVVGSRLRNSAVCDACESQVCLFHCSRCFCVLFSYWDYDFISARDFQPIFFIFKHGVSYGSKQIVLLMFMLLYLLVFRDVDFV